MPWTELVPRHRSCVLPAIAIATTGPAAAPGRGHDRHGSTGGSAWTIGKRIDTDRPCRRCQALTPTSMLCPAHHRRWPRRDQPPPPAGAGHAALSAPCRHADPSAGPWRGRSHWRSWPLDTPQLGGEWATTGNARYSPSFHNLNYAGDFWCPRRTAKTPLPCRIDFRERVILEIACTAGRMFNSALASGLNADHAGRVSPDKGRHRGRLGARGQTAADQTGGAPASGIREDVLGYDCLITSCHWASPRQDRRNGAA